PRPPPTAIYTLSLHAALPISSVKPDILVNATPAGTRGDLENVSIATADELNGVKLVYDLIYNPLETLLIREARAAGCDTRDGLRSEEHTSELQSRENLVCRLL